MKKIPEDKNILKLTVTIQKKKYKKIILPPIASVTTQDAHEPSRLD